MYVQNMPYSGTLSLSGTQHCCDSSSSSSAVMPLCLIMDLAGSRHRIEMHISETLFIVVYCCCVAVLACIQLVSSASAVQILDGATQSMIPAISAMCRR
jgi:hypothetical protein